MCVCISCDTGGSRLPDWLTPHADRSALPQSLDRPANRPPDRPANRDEAGGEGNAHDPGDGDRAARFAARRLAGRLDAPLIENEYSPRLVDVARSVGNRRLFPSLASEWGSSGDGAAVTPRSRASRWKRVERIRLVDEIHTPYRTAIRQQISRLMIRHPFVVHLSVRAFAAKYRGSYRRTDIGLAYDPAAGHEVAFCLDWIDELYDRMPMVRVRRNYPRRGTIDSITRSMRRHFDGMPYLGIELQLNRAWAARPVAARDRVLDGVASSLRGLTSLLQSEAA